jgi:hypothetical protein
MCRFPQGYEATALKMQVELLCRAREPAAGRTIGCAVVFSGFTVLRYDWLGGRSEGVVGWVGRLMEVGR